MSTGICIKETVRQSRWPCKLCSEVVILLQLVILYLHLEMTVLSLKLILALSCISALCLGTGVADTCPTPASVQQCTTGIDQIMIDIIHILERGKEKLTMKYPLTSCKDVHDCDPSAPSGYYWIKTTTGTRRMFCAAGTVCKHASIRIYWLS